MRFCFPIAVQPGFVLARGTGFAALHSPSYLCATNRQCPHPLDRTDRRSADSATYLSQIVND